LIPNDDCQWAAINALAQKLGVGSTPVCCGSLCCREKG